jgi:glycosyltransferase involved in cell wall biosynthesis
MSTLAPMRATPGSPPARHRAPPSLTPARDISVVIATCNRPDTLVDAVRSALQQKGAIIEVIVVDDSPERTAATAIAGLADARIRYVANPEPSRGRPAIARNLGASYARGALVHFLDDDDIVPPGHYAAACAAFAARPEIGVVFGAIEPFGADETAIAGERRYFAQAGHCARLGDRWAFTAAMLFGPTLLVCSAGMVRREHLRAIGGFDPALPLMEDADFYMRAIRHAGVHFLDRPSLRYRIGPSLMRQPDRDRLIRESWQLTQFHYRQRRGAVEFTLLKILAKGLRLS